MRTGSQTGVDIIKKAGIGNFELLFLNAENIPDDLELVINKIMVVLNAFNEDEKNKIYDEYNLEGEWKISINLK